MPIVPPASGSQMYWPRSTLAKLFNANVSIGSVKTELKLFSFTAIKPSFSGLDYHAAAVGFKVLQENPSHAKPGHRRVWQLGGAAVPAALAVTLTAKHTKLPPQARQEAGARKEMVAHQPLCCCIVSAPPNHPFPAPGTG